MSRKHGVGDMEVVGDVVVVRDVVVSSLPTMGQTPGLEVNSRERFRAADRRNVAVCMGHIWVCMTAVCSSRNNSKAASPTLGGPQLWRCPVDP